MRAMYSGVSFPDCFCTCSALFVGCSDEELFVVCYCAEPVMFVFISTFCLSVQFFSNVKGPFTSFKSSSDARTKLFLSYSVQAIIVCE